MHGGPPTHPPPAPANLADDPLCAAAAAAIAAADNPHALNMAKSAHLGPKSPLKQELNAIGKLPAAARRAAGAANNQKRDHIQTLLAARGRELKNPSPQDPADAHQQDVTLPGRAGGGAGGIHPLHHATRRAVALFAACGFQVAEGPEIESDHYNFTALNQPPAHPARSMQDTFYFHGGALLRTHTSPVQIRHMEQNRDRLPIRAISPGRVYRRDHDSTHSPMFHQIEGLWIDDRVRFTDLKGILAAFFRAFFDDDRIVTRFRPSFFPFTEPSAECDIRRSDGDSWLEVAGCGMIHPAVLRAGGIDPAHHQGFAFGMGIERLAMLHYRIDDIRQFFDNDLRFLAQFPR